MVSSWIVLFRISVINEKSLIENLFSSSADRPFTTVLSAYELQQWGLRYQDWISYISFRNCCSNSCIIEFQLVTFSKVSRNSTFVLTIYPNGKSSKSGTDIALQATFRFILNDKPSSEFSSLSDVIGRSVMLELFASPGMLVVRGTDDELVVTDSSSVHGSSIFRLVTRWDGKAETVSLESVTQKGCFVSTSVNLKSGASMKLSCNTESTEVGFNNAASFAMEKELSIILSTLLQREQRGIFFWCHY